MAPPYYLLGGNPEDYPAPPAIKPVPRKLLDSLKTASHTLLDRADPFLAAFFKATADVKPIRLAACLKVEYSHDPLATLKLLCLLRCLGEPGKAGFTSGLLWLHQHHPFTLARNVSVFGGEFGWFKDLLDVLYLILKRVEFSMITKKKEMKIKKGKGQKVKEETKESLEKDSKQNGCLVTNKSKDLLRAKMGLKRYREDEHYRYLHDRISAMFAELLRSDLQYMNRVQFEKISMAAKFCPSIDSCYDKSTLICESIARQVFPRDEYEEYKDIEGPHYAYRVRNRLQKQVLVPLRKTLDKSKEMHRLGVERQDSTVAAIQACRKLFLEPDEEKKRRQYMKIEDKYGKWTINFDDRVLPPHKISILMNKRYEAAELHWQKLVKALSKNEKLRPSVAICDNSESTGCTYVEDLIVVMGLLVSEISIDPWKGKIFTSGDYPKLCRLDGDDIRSKSEFLRQLDCAEENLNFLKVYDRILQVSISEKLSNDRVVKRIFLFTNKKFTDSIKERWIEDYREAWKSYRKRGYKTVPEIVFWNLNGFIVCPKLIHSPTDNHHKGVLVVRGYSRSLMRMVFENDFHSTNEYLQAATEQKGNKLLPEPADLISSAISRDGFKNLVVKD